MFSAISCTSTCIFNELGQNCGYRLFFQYKDWPVVLFTHPFSPRLSGIYRQELWVSAWVSVLVCLSWLPKKQQGTFYGRAGEREEIFWLAKLIRNKLETSIANSWLREQADTSLLPQLPRFTMIRVLLLVYYCYYFYYRYHYQNSNLQKFHGASLKFANRT